MRFSCECYFPAESRPYSLSETGMINHKYANTCELTHEMKLNLMDLIRVLGSCQYLCVK
jgi:hypothetical protein